MLQKDRRIDRGAKYSPVFGRYSFVDAGSEGVSVAVGDEVRIVRRNEAQTVFSKSKSKCCMHHRQSVRRSSFPVLTQVCRLAWFVHQLNVHFGNCSKAFMRLSLVGNILAHNRIRLIQFAASTNLGHRC